MKRKIWGIGILCLVGLALVAATAIVPTYFPGGVRIGPDRNFTQPYLLKLDNPSGTTVFSVDNQGRVNNDDVVILNNVNQFTTYAGSSGSGASIYRTLWGKRYIVDPYAISISRGLGALGAVTAIQAFTGVSMILPYATSSASMYQSTTVEMRLTGTTGYDFCKSGGTKIWVWAPVHPSATSYNTSSANVSAFAQSVVNAGATYQTVHVALPNMSESTVTYFGATNKITSLTTGGSVWGINKPGESYTFEYVNGSGTSVIMTGRNVIDTSNE